MSDEKSKHLSAYFEGLARLVASGESTKAAAESVGCASSTAYRIAAKDDFKQEVARLRSEFVASATGKLSTACSDAVEVIIDLAKNADDERVKLRAAVAVLDRFVKMSEHNELRERIEALESDRGSSE